MLDDQLRGFRRQQRHLGRILVRMFIAGKHWRIGESTKQIASKSRVGWEMGFSLRMGMI